MVPAKAPLPTTSSFPFHPLAGSQTSILMSELRDGFSVAATRQNAGSAANGSAAFAPPARPAGGRKVPVATVCATVTVRAEVDSEVNDSHGAAKAPAGIRSVTAVS